MNGRSDHTKKIHVTFDAARPTAGRAFVPFLRAIERAHGLINMLMQCAWIYDNNRVLYVASRGVAVHEKSIANKKDF